MAIIFDEKKRTFTLHTKQTTYQMQVDRFGFLLHLYYGRTAKGCMDYLLTYYDRGFSGNPYDTKMDRTYSMDALPQEFPCQGTGDYRSCAIHVEQGDGTQCCDLRYKSHEIKKGKYGLRGLPAVYALEEEADTLAITMEDRATGLCVVLYYGVLTELDVITRSAKVINHSTEKVYVEKLQTACLDFVSGTYDVISFYGRHAMERTFQRIPVAHGNYVIGSRRGTSSHQYNPLLILAEATATEAAGSCYGMSFVYSGGFKGEVEKDQYNQTRMLLGLQEEAFRYPLEPGESLYAPEVMLTYSQKGLSQLSHQFHACIRTHICRGIFKEKTRPVLLNSWEASYFKFTGDSLVALSETAKEVGIEMLVMDDGWFGKREDDNTGLGDWYVNEEKLGGTLKNLIERINGMGMKFGIWVEPEMVSIDSELYRAHPEYALVIPGRKPNRSRNQLLLDFSRREVVDAIYEQICEVLDQGNIEYVKWDMNRSLADIYSAETKDQGRVIYDYILGLYDFLERLLERYPKLLIEGCSGGGGRFDAGMLYYTPQIWCSDNTDAIDRISIQYGTSFGYPTSAVGSHVSAVPNHQTGRSVSMKTRGITAMAGTFGYELNLLELSREEKDAVKQQIATYHKYAALIQRGTYYRLTNPLVEEVGAWAFVSEDKTEVLIQAVMLEIHGNMTVNYLKFAGLLPDAMYQEESSKQVYSGSALMEAGIPLSVVIGSYESHQMYLKRVPD